MKAYHFLPKTYGLEALRRRRIKIARLEELNDPFELAPPGNSISQHRKAFQKVKSELNLDRGLICFTKGWHNPLMWSHYAGRHTGIALGFDVPSEYFDVEYRKSRLSCDWDRFAREESYALATMRRVFSTKSWDWRYEQEVRAHIKLDPSTVDNGRYFFNFEDGLVLREVIVGPNCEIPRKEFEQVLLGYSHKVSLIKARLAFRDFRIVHQRDKSLW